MSQVKKVIYPFAVLLLLGWSFIGYIVWDYSRPAALTVNFLDIGQGDAILIQTASRRTVLVDGGPDNAVVYKLGEYLPFYQRTIDLMVLTHPDADHLMGLTEVVRRYRVGAVLVTGVENDTAAYRAALAALAEQRVKILVAGDVSYIFIDRQTGLAILYPRQSLAGQTFKALNDSSIVSRLEVRGFSVLLTGDQTLKVENELLAQGVDPRATVLKVAHHGSHTGTSESFLQAVAPQLAVISSGRDNHFGHPHPDIVARLAAAGITVLNTQQSGDITLRLEPSGLSVTTAGILELEK